MSSALKLQPISFPLSPCSPIFPPATDASGPPESDDIDLARLRISSRPCSARPCTCEPLHAAPPDDDTSAPSPVTRLQRAWSRVARVQGAQPCGEREVALRLRCGTRSNSYSRPVRLSPLLSHHRLSPLPPSSLPPPSKAAFRRLL